MSRAITASALSGVNRDTSVRQAPVPTAALSPHVWPNEWNSGSPPKTTSSGLRLNRSVAATEALVARLAWVSSAPLGAPVVPDVYRMTAVSDPVRSTVPGTAVAPSSRFAPMTRQSAPACPAPSRAASAHPGAAKMRRACESPR